MSRYILSRRVTHADNVVPCVTDFYFLFINSIESIMSRLLSGILDSRLRDIIKQSIRQKGFTKEDGCKANINLLNAALARIKTESGGVITVVNISKAFNTMPHTALQKCLTRKGVSKTVANYVQSMYDNCSTQIRTKEESVSGI